MTMPIFTFKYRRIISKLPDYFTLLPTEARIHFIHGFSKGVLRMTFNRSILEPVTTTHDSHSSNGLVRFLGNVNTKD